MDFGLDAEGMAAEVGHSVRQFMGGNVSAGWQRGGRGVAGWPGSVMDGPGASLAGLGGRQAYSPKEQIARDNTALRTDIYRRSVEARAVRPASVGPE